MYVYVCMYMSIYVCINICMSIYVYIHSYIKYLVLGIVRLVHLWYDTYTCDLSNERKSLSVHRAVQLDQQTARTQREERTKTRGKSKGVHPYAQICCKQRLTCVWFQGFPECRSNLGVCTCDCVWECALVFVFLCACLSSHSARAACEHRAQSKSATLSALARANDDRAWSIFFGFVYKQLWVWICVCMCVCVPPRTVREQHAGRQGGGRERANWYTQQYSHAVPAFHNTTYSSIDALPEFDTGLPKGP